MRRELSQIMSRKDALPSQSFTTPKKGVNSNHSTPLNIVYMTKYGPNNISGESENNNSKIPVKYCVNPLLSHIYNCELKSLLASYDNTNNTSKYDDSRLWWIEDLYSDNDDLSTVILRSNEVANPMSNSEVFYPHSTYYSAGVILLNEEKQEQTNSQDDSFIKLLKTAYKGTNREMTETSQSIRKKITFLSKDGVALKSIEFTTEKDYYGILFAIKRYFNHDKNLLSFTGKCILSNNQTDSSGTFQTGTKSNESRSIFSKLTSSTISYNETKDENNYAIEMVDGTIKISDHGTVLLRFNLHDIHAIAITLDNIKQSPLLLTASIDEDYTTSYGIRFNSPDESIDQSPIKPDTLLSSLVLPVSTDQLQSTINLESRSSAFDVKLLPMTVQVISKLALSSGSKNTAIIGDSVIPYESFFTDNHNSSDQAQQNYQDLISRQLRINERIYSNVQLKEVDVRRGVRIYIHNGTGLPSSTRSVPPSAYCTVYLVGKNNDKLSLNTIESRTEVIEKSFDPLWDKEIILEGGQHVPGIDTSGLEGVTGVMIKVRDAASGILKHHHIGQVVIPINCFLYQTEATFTLPLEPTNRMNQNELRYLGEISLSTELVTLESILKIQGVNDHDHMTLNGRRLSIVSPRQQSHYFSVLKPGNENGRVIPVNYTLHDTWNFAKIWWPFKTIYGGEVRGHILANHEFLYLKLLPGASGVLTNCKEIDLKDNSHLIIEWNKVETMAAITETTFMLAVTFNHITSLPSQRAKGEYTYVPVTIDLVVAPCPAMDLENIIHDRLKTWNIRRRLIKFVQSFKSSAFCGMYMTSINAQEGNSPGQYSPQSSSNRMSVPTPSSAIPPPNPGGTLSPTPPTRNRSSALWNPTGNSGNLLNTGHHHNTSCRELLTEGKAIYSLLERSIQQINQQLHLLPTNSTSKQQYQSLKRLLLRNYLYLSQLLSFCKCFEESLDGPSYRLSHILKMIDEDCSDGQILTPLRSGANPKSLMDRHNYLYDIAILRIREYLICSGNQWGKFFEKDNVFVDMYHQSIISTESNTPSGVRSSNFKPALTSPQFNRNVMSSPSNGNGIAYHTPNAVGISSPIGHNSSTMGHHLSLGIAMSSPMGLNTVSPSSVIQTTLHPTGATVIPAKNGLEELLSGYINALRISLSPYITTKQAFQKIEGQELKTLLIRLIMETNHRLAHKVLSILSIYGLTVQSSVSLSSGLDLYEDSIIHDIMDWYTQNILTDMKFWMNRMFVSITTNKENKYEHPWDYDVVGSKFISHLPELFINQVRVYCNLCFESKKNIQDLNQKSNKKNLLKYQSVNHQRFNSVNNGVEDEDRDADGGEDENEVDQRVYYYYQYINEKLLLSCYKLFLLVHDEYNRVLSMKHWYQAVDSSHSSSNQILIKNCEFLISICNDCHRILTTHMSIFDSITVISNPMLSIQIQYQIIHHYSFILLEKTIKHIVKLISYNYLDSFLLNLDELSIDISQNRVHMIHLIVNPIHSILNTIKYQMEYMNYCKLIQAIVNLIMKRILLYFKEKSILKKKYSNEEMIHWQQQILELKDSFLSYLQNYMNKDIVGNDDSSTSSQSNQSPEEAILINQFTIVLETIELIKLNPNSANFSNLIRLIIHRYHSSAPSLSNKATEAVKENKNSNPGMIMNTLKNITPQMLECYHKIPLLIFYTYVSLRNDCNQELIDYLISIYEESLKSYGLVSLSLSTHQSIAYHLNESIFMNIQPNEIRKPLPYIVLTSTSAKYHPMIVFEDLFQSIFTEDELKAITIPVFKESPLSSSTSILNHSLMSSNPAKLKPSNTLKMLREKASDIALIGLNTKQKKTDEYVLQVYRSLGLEEIIDSDKIPGSSGTSLEHSNTFQPHSVTVTLDTLIMKHDLLSNMNGMNEDMILVSRRNTNQSDHSFGSNDDISNPSMILPGEDMIPHMNDCTIIVSNIQLKGLRSSSYFTNANPYVVMTLGNQRMKTSVKSNANETEWKSASFRFPFLTSKLSSYTMFIRVYDKEMIRRKRLLGGVAIKLAGIELRSILSWFALEGGAVGSTGEIYLKIEYDSKV